MGVRDLNETERGIAFQCVQYVLKGGYFDVDLDTRLGLTLGELQSLLSEWPDIQDDDASHYASCGMNSCFNEVCNGITFSPSEWNKWFTVPESEVCKTYEYWREIRKRIDPDNAGSGLR